jgi:hypothetical protein
MFMRKIFPILLLAILVISGCVEEGVPETTTTTIATTTTETTVTTTSTTEEPEANTTTISKDCRFLNFQIKSHAYRNEDLTIYFENLGSEVIDDFEVRLNYSNRTDIESFEDQSIPRAVVKIYDIEAGPGLENVTVVENHCGKSYYLNV